PQGATAQALKRALNARTRERANARTRERANALTTAAVVLDRRAHGVDVVRVVVVMERQARDVAAWTDDDVTLSQPLRQIRSVFVDERDLGSAGSRLDREAELFSLGSELTRGVLGEVSDVRVHVLWVQAADEGHSGVSGVERGHVGRTGFEPPRLIRKVEVARSEAHRIDAHEPPRQGGWPIGIRW